MTEDENNLAELVRYLNTAVALHCQWERIEAALRSAFNEGPPHQVAKRAARKIEAMIEQEKETAMLLEKSLFSSSKDKSR